MQSHLAWGQGMTFRRTVDDVAHRILSATPASADLLAMRLAAECLERTGCSGAGLSLMTESGAEAILAATDTVATRLEELQFNYGEGPCTTTIELRSPVLHPELALTGYTLWPFFTSDALGAGAQAIFAFPIRCGEVHLGALELYRGTPGWLSGAEYYQAQIYAEAAVSLLVRSQAGEEFATLYPHLTKILDDRIEVQIATGMVAVHAEVDIDNALALLRAHAFAQQRTVLEVAIDIVERRVTITKR